VRRLVQHGKESGYCNNQGSVKIMRKYFFGSLLLLTFAFSAHAAGLSETQIQAIMSLLSSFNVDAPIVKNVEMALRGGTPLAGSNPSTTFCHTFSIDLQLGDYTDLRSGIKGVDLLQEILVKEGFTIDVSEDSRNYGSNFGQSTLTAVKQFQTKYGINPTGYVGPLTRAKLNSLYGCGIPTFPIEPTDPQSSKDSFSVKPTSGVAPLFVSFYVGSPSDWPRDYSGNSYQTKLEYGDGSSDFVIPGDCHACGGSHTYKSAGTYVAKLTKYNNYPNGGEVVGTVTIKVQ
jgi:hypothetical protein